MAGRCGSVGGRLAAARLSVVALVTCVTACVPASVGSDGRVPQDPPIATNGLAPDGDHVWAADIAAGQIVRFELSTGRIDERYGPKEGLCHTDDLVIAPDGRVIATCPTEGLVIAIERGGRATRLAAVGRGVNPIVLDPSGTSVLVGFEIAGRRDLLRVPLDGSAVTTVATGLPQINGVDLDSHGRLWAPTGGTDGLLGTGGLGWVDLTTGVFTKVALRFADRSQRGLRLACGVAVGPHDEIYVAQCVSPEVYRVDPTTGFATLVGRPATPVADNIASLPDGRVLMSPFTGNVVTVFDPVAHTRSTVSIGD